MNKTPHKDPPCLSRKHGSFAGLGYKPRVSQRGMISLAALFMVLFVTAMIWAALGIGRTIYVREGLQDGADAAAYSAAVFHAKGMNLIALINLIMAALVTILLVLRMAQTVLEILTVLFLALSYFGGGSAALATQTANSANTMNGYFKKAKNIVEPILEGLHGLQEATAAVVPAVALVDGMIEAAKHHHPAEGAFAIPARFTLPIEEDAFARTCKEAQKMVIEGTRQASGLALLPKPAQDIVLKPIDAALYPIASLTSLFLCGTGDGKVPEHKQKVDVRYPRPSGLDSCEEETDGAECTRARRQLELAEPRAGTGECQTQCGWSDPYESLARAARMSCDPTRGRMKEFVWQERTVSATILRDRGGTRETDRTEGPLRLVEGNRAPCGRDGKYSSDWNTDSGDADQEIPRPLCVQDVTPSGSRQARHVKYTEVVRIFSCVRVEKKAFPVADPGDAFGGWAPEAELAGLEMSQTTGAATDALGDKSGGSGSSKSSGGSVSGAASGDASTDSSAGEGGNGDTQSSSSEERTPHKVEKGLKMGNNAFQIRAVSFGPEPGPGSNQRFVDLIDPSRNESEGDQGGGKKQDDRLGAAVQKIMGSAGRIAVAQAEYYFAGTSNEDDWLWTLEWTARMRRFRLSKSDDTQDGGSETSALDAQSACSDQGKGICGKLQVGLSAMENWIKH